MPGAGCTHCYPADYRLETVILLQSGDGDGNLVARDSNMFRKYVQWSYFYKGVSVGTKGGIQSVTLNKENEVKIKDDMVKSRIFS